MGLDWRASHLFLLIISFGPILCSKFEPKGPDISHLKLNFTFTQVSYNGSVEENSAGSTLISTGGEKMGIWYEPRPSMSASMSMSTSSGGASSTGNNGMSVIEYKIVSGDPLRLFRVEERQVGNFCFLIIRVNNNERSLNREFKDLYRLQVKATLYHIENESDTLEEKRLEEKEQFNELFMGTEDDKHHKLKASTDKSVTSNDGDNHRHMDNLRHRLSTTTSTTASRDDTQLVQNDYQTPSKSLASLAHQPSVSASASETHLRLSLPFDQSQLKKSNTRNTTANTNNPPNRRNRNRVNSGSNKRNKSSKSTLSRRAGRDETRIRNKTRTRSKTGASSSEKQRRKQKDKSRVSLSTNTSSSVHPQVPITSTTSTQTPSTTTDTAMLSTMKPVLVPIAETYATILITIEDVNDNIPVFEHPSYDIGVNSDAPVLSKIAKISANDADVGLNQETYYSLVEFSPLFAIDPITAVLSPVRPLGSSSRERHQIRVRAKNRWNSGLTASESTAKVNIHIRSTSRRAPQIFVNHPPKVDWRPYGVIFAVVSVRHSEIVDLVIKEGDPNGLFRVTNTVGYNEFYLEMPPIVASNLNYKELTPNVFNLTLKATDRGDPPKSSVHELQINLNDGPWSTKSAAALFDKDVYEVTISESAPPHSVVFRLKRPDAKVILSISSGNEGEEFTLDKSGVLYTSRWLDMETKSSYTLTIDSLDLRPGRIDQVRRHRSVVKIIVRLSDENDNSPIFTQLPGNASIVYVMENEPIGTKLFKVTARDRDLAENGYVTYSIANLKPVPVTIDHFTGEVKTVEVLDAEKSRQRYTIKIRASDWGSPFRRESEISVRLVLRGSNDNRPLFTVTNCVAVIDRNIKFETEFGKLGAIDFDRNDVISYRIVGGNEDGCFSLDSSLGRLRVTCDLRDLRASTRYLNVTASDGEFYSDVHTIKIELRDSLRTNFNKSDSIRTGIKLYSTSQSVFECQDTGVQDRFDRLTALFEENNKLEEGEVDESTFSHLPSRYGENAHSPYFVDFPNELMINENAEVGTILHKLQARDFDRGYNGLLTFVITGGDENHGAWDLVTTQSSSLTGELVQEAHLVVAAPLDREEFLAYTLNITIWDHGTPPKMASKLLSIKIIDANDCPPVFDKAAVRVKILEGNQLVGKPILQLKATDCDLEGSPNSMITYRFIKDSYEFSIDETSGEIRVMAELDRELQDSYELIVMAQDKGVPKLSSMATVTILVDDRNDEKPKFLNVSRTLKIKEDWPVGAIVTKVLAIDRDDGLYGTVRYSLVEGSKGDFVLDPISGVLRVAKELDYEKIFLYNLTINARDLGVPSLSSDTFIVIEMLNVQETMEPIIRFPDIVAKTTVSEESPIGTLLYTVMPVNYILRFSYPGIIFSLEGKSKFSFTIDNNGVLRTARILDYEVEPSHWLTIIAQSGINTNNFAQMEMYIEVQPVNDCTPLTTLPMYSFEVEENTPSNVSIVQIDAFDCDENNGLRFALKSPNPLFDIDSFTGEISTTSTPLDREKQTEVSFDVMVSDSGSPSLNSTTKVTVKILDQNDNAPIFLEFGSIQVIPELLNVQLQKDEAGEGNEEDDENQIDVDNEDQEDALKWSDWHVIHVSPSEALADGWRKLHRVVAFDEDEGKNGELRYRLKYRVNSDGTSGETDMFSIHYETGDIYTSASSIKSETILKFVIEASDLGTIPLTTESQLILKVKEVNRQESLFVPKVLQSNEHKVTITRRERPGYTVEILDVEDQDSDQLWFEIVSGDPEQHFIMYPDSPNLILAKSIHSQTNFKLNISASDGFNIVFTLLNVDVIESERVSSLIWEAEHYSTRISELVADSSVVATVRVKESSSSNWTSSSAPILYGFHNAQDLRSLKIFTIDTLTGIVTVAQAALIDRESLAKHILTVKARDPANIYSYVRLEVEIEDENDNLPVFTRPRHEIRISESTPVDSFLTQIQAFDADSGENGRLSYSITFGNVGSTFHIDKNSGRIFLKKPLSIAKGETFLEYHLIIKAVDHGTSSLSATTILNVAVTLQSDADFLQLDCSTEDDLVRNELRLRVKENALPGTYVTTIRSVNSGSVSFEIEENKNNFWIDPATGIILVGKNKELLNREIKSSYDLVVRATNSRGIIATCNLKIDVQDENDNRPMFTEAYYEGEIAEDAQVGALVLAKTRGSKDGSIKNKSPFTLRATDLDEGSNSIVTYSIVEDEMRTVFHMVPSSGSLNLVTTLDHEKRSNYIFHVRAIDGGGLLSENMATVNISVQPVNNKAPVVKSSRVDCLVPTAPGATVHVMEATDADGDTLHFNITRGNTDKLFDIEAQSGKIIIGKNGSYALGKHVLEISASDGKFTTIATITIHVKLMEQNPAFGFRNVTYFASAIENSTKIVNVMSLTVFGGRVNEHLQFSILNPTPFFRIGRTSGVILTTGVKLDRERQTRHQLLVQVRGDEAKRLARSVVEIQVTDINDMCPVFYNLPYYAVVSLDSKPGDFIFKVKALDEDEGENKLVRYELVRSPFGDFYEMDKQLGEIRLRRKFDGIGTHEIIIKAYDGGVPTCTSEAAVEVKIVSSYQPVFEKQWYEASVPENSRLQSTVLTVTAHSKNAVLYSIDPALDEFDIDHLSGTVYVNSVLDYESVQEYKFVVKVTDIINSTWSSAVVQVKIDDSNDNIPQFEKMNYSFRIAEGYMPSHGVIGTLAAFDKDTGKNSALTFELVGKQNLVQVKANNNAKQSMTTLKPARSMGCNASQWFAVQPNQGSILLRRPLDYNAFQECLFSVRVSDSGIPNLSSETRVNIHVLAVNKNAPIFEQSNYVARISEIAKRNQLVAKVSALDPDFDAIEYAIVHSSYPESVFAIDPLSGIITLAESSVLLSELSFTLNISATDLIFTSYCKLEIYVEPKNNIIPYFSSLIYEVGCAENCEGCHIANINATDPDRSLFGKVSYSIADSDDRDMFQIDDDGNIRLSPGMSMDRETKDSHSLEVRAEDGGGWLGYTKVVVKVGDINEFPPQFLVPEYRVTISSKKARSKLPILQVNAIDLDTEFGVQYSIVEIPTQNSTTQDSSYFMINQDTGEIHLKQSDKNMSVFGKDRLDFQFWVKAADEQGLNSHVPVKVIVLMDGDMVPEIQPQNATFFVKEDALIGSIVTTFKVANIDTPQFRVVSLNSDLFQVDLQGNLLLKARLDQDQTDKHTVVVWAESQDGISVATSQVTIRVLVSKDKETPPHFNLPKYYVKVSEDLPEGSLIFTARAVNADTSGSTKVKERYMIVPENHHFAINPEYGWITLMNELDYETNTEHILHVIASDSEKRQATATVVIEVLNINDMPTRFTNEEYFVEVSEDIPEGTTIAALPTTDLDWGSHEEETTLTTTFLNYYITAGNERETFRINGEGHISTWRKLDCETNHIYKLKIAVTDGTHIDYANLSINVLDVNDNVPICPVPEYEHRVTENVPLGTFLLIIEAYDPDHNAQSPTFLLMGDGANDFKIDPESGIVIVDNNLDAEGEFNPYVLTVIAKDRDHPFDECSSTLRIYIEDVNDIHPRFTELGYNFAVKEDAVPGSWIGKVHADDKDLTPINHKVHYVLLSVTSGSELVKDQFEVDSKSGIISILRPLDREIISNYSLSIQASDSGVVPLSTLVQAKIEVRDVNDNEPLFEHQYYVTSISELAEVSTEVVRVRATSKDIGVNAEITYDIIGGNSYNHFTIHKTSGAITVNSSLDFERVREYVLTVRAKDAGTPPLYQQCMVNISLIDANDNPPLFNQNSYSVMISEDTSIATSVIKVTATDIDSGENALVRYKVGSGDRMNNFHIDSRGVITVASALDREMIPQYTLEIWAIDSGSPQLSSSTTVAVEITDVNDEKPTFSQESYSAVVQEDRQIGYTVLTFEVSDADAYPNSIPFSWDLHDMDEEKGVPLPFTVSDLGTLNVAGKLNFQRKKLYHLRVRVFDSGNPPLYADTNVTVKVVEASHWPPVVSSLVVTVLSVNSEYPAGIPLGRIHATDFDVHDKLVYSLIKTPASSSFLIDHVNGTLKSLTPLREGVYELGVAVTDGRWTARGDAYIKVSALASLMPDIQLEANQMDENANTNSRVLPNVKSRKEMSLFAVVLTVKGHSPQSLLSRMFAFVNAIKESVAIDSASGTSYDVMVLSVQPASDNTNGSSSGQRRNKREADIPSVDILLAVRKSGEGSFVQPHLLTKKLRFASAQLEAVLSAKVTRIINDICNNTSCERGQCKTVVVFEGTQSLISTETMSLITPNHYLSTICHCPVGYGGTRCEKVVNACANSECHLTGHICVPDTSLNGYACLCKKTYCSQDGSCEDACTQQSVSFSGTSFLAYNVGSNLERELSISFKIKTLYTSGTLLYSFGYYDYALLEIKQGLVQFSVDLGTGKEVLTLTSISVSDNRWHSVMLHLKDNHAILKVDERSTLNQKLQGPARSLHTCGIIYVGAKIIGAVGDSIDNLLPSIGYIGCMKDLRYGYLMENSSTDGKIDLHIQEVKHYITPGLNTRTNTNDATGLHYDTEDEELPQIMLSNGKLYPLPLHNTLKPKVGPFLLRSRNISFTCDRILNVMESCRSQPCLNGGTCSEDRGTGYKCSCPSRFQGFNCEIDRDPCSSSPCLNNGVCSATNSAEISFSPSVVTGNLQSNQFHCNCVDGTFGARCERGKWCKDSTGDSDVCHSRGECEEGQAEAICWCEPGYTGATCQLDINECERGDACGSGSTCVNFLGGFRCLCPENATGRTCNRRTTDAPSLVTHDYHIILLIIVVVVSFILFLIIFIIVRRCCCRRRSRNLTNTIALTSTQVKDKSTRIPAGRDNRDLLRNRDSKISNLEVRPVSAGSDIFPSDIRTAVDPIKSYSSGDDLEKPQFINNLMKNSSGDKRRYGQPSWETNRDDYPKIQNYMKGEISWGSKGNKPNSPVRLELGAHWDSDAPIPSINISPTRTLPPPMDIPDTVSNDSNTEISDANINALLSSPDTPKHRAETSPDSHATDEGTSCDENWPLPNPEYCLLNDSAGDEASAVNEKPVAIRNRYRRSPNSNNVTGRNSNSDEEGQEHLQLLTPSEDLATNATSPTTHPSCSTSLIPLPITAANSSPRKNSVTSSSKAFNNDKNGQTRVPKKNFKKTTHITEV